MEFAQLERADITEHSLSIFLQMYIGRSSFSACPFPVPSTSSSASVYRNSLLNQHGRQSYLSLRSQGRQNSSPAPLSIYQSLVERLITETTTASNNQTATESRAEAKPTPRHQQRLEQEVNKVVRSSIRQVTSAIGSDGNQLPPPTSGN